MRAEFRGYCDLCDDAISPGDDIRRASETEGSWVHVDCMSRLDADVNRVLGQLGVSRPRCTSCADLLVAGSCPNCDG